MQRRAFLQSGCLATAACGLSRPLAAMAALGRLDALVSRSAERSDLPVFRSIAAALAAVPADRPRSWRIGIDTGTWTEKLVIDQPGIELLGAGRKQTVLSHATAAGDLRPDGEPWGTWGCASVIVRAPDFRASALSIENAFDYIGHLYDPSYQPIGANGLQAVALMLDGGADRCLFSDVAVTGHQDTLFVDAGRSLWRNCHISGSVDFIFGAGQAVFERCELLSRFRPDKPRQGYVAAPSTLRQHAVGLLFERCRLQREADVPDASVALGRPWRPTRSFPDGRYGDPQVAGQCLYRRCWMDAHIDAAGWDAMGFTAPDGSKQMLQPGQARLAEFRNHGPGAHRGDARPQLSEDDNRALSGVAALGDWASAQGT